MAIYVNKKMIKLEFILLQCPSNVVTTKIPTRAIV